MNKNKLLVGTLALVLIAGFGIPAYAQLTAGGTVPSETTPSEDIPIKVLGLPYETGDVFAGTGNGMIDVYRPDGTFVQTLDTTSASSEQTGMCFDKDGNLYATSFTTSTMTFFDDSGNIITHPWGGPSNLHNESCVVDGAGNVYVGQADGTRDVLKFAPDGTFIDSYDVATSPRGSDWIDLAADQCTLYYTSEGGAIKRYDVCTKTQLADFTTEVLSGPCFALRIMDDGEVMVACSNQAYRIATDGTIAQTYPKSGFSPEPGSFLFALNLDPDGDSFWTAAYTTGEVYNIDIATGNQLGTFTATPRVFSVAGLAIAGEVIQAQCPPGFEGIPPKCIPIDVAGEIIPIDSTALFLAGLSQSMVWMIPTLAGIAGAGIVIRHKLRN